MRALPPETHFHVVGAILPEILGSGSRSSMHKLPYVIKIGKLYLPQASEIDLWSRSAISWPNFPPNISKRFWISPNTWQKKKSKPKRKKLRLDWAGGLAEFNESYTSLELQKIPGLVGRLSYLIDSKI